MEKNELKKLLMGTHQKQPFPDVLQNRYSYNIHRNTPVLESLFNKVAGLSACNFVKKRLQHRGFPMHIAQY